MSTQERFSCKPLLTELPSARRFRQGELSSVMMLSLLSLEFLKVTRQDALRASRAVFRLATFYSRSRMERWCKGETSGHFIRVTGIFPDCDRDSLLYMGDPVGPACHTVSHRYFLRLPLCISPLRNTLCHPSVCQADVKCSLHVYIRKSCSPEQACIICRVHLPAGFLR